MSTPTSPTVLQGTYQSLGGTLVVPPQPDESCYPLRLDQFQTLCDGEMSEARSIRDACVGAVATGVFGIAGLYFTIDWGSAISHVQKGPFVVTTILCFLTLASVGVAVVEHRRMKQTRGHSTYSRLVKVISVYFKISAGT